MASTGRLDLFRLIEPMRQEGSNTFQDPVQDPIHFCGQNRTGEVRYVLMYSITTELGDKGDSLARRQIASSSLLNLGRSVLVNQMEHSGVHSWNS